MESYDLRSCNFLITLKSKRPQRCSLMNLKVPYKHVNLLEQWWETLSQTSVPISQPKHLNLPSLSGLANPPPPQPTPKTYTLKKVYVYVFMCLYMLLTMTHKWLTSPSHHLPLSVLSQNPRTNWEHGPPPGSLRLCSYTMLGTSVPLFKGLMVYV